VDVVGIGGTAVAGTVAVAVVGIAAVAAVWVDRAVAARTLGHTREDTLAGLGAVVVVAAAVVAAAAAVVVVAGTSGAVAVDEQRMQDRPIAR